MDDVTAALADLKLDQIPVYLLKTQGVCARALLINHMRGMSFELALTHPTALAGRVLCRGVNRLRRIPEHVAECISPANTRPGCVVLQT